ncbi:MAG: UDP-N-acetylmuramoyl-L-alanyl-D-glutamate--2,6-diaminopimelate ligase [Spirochaetales bacterium]|nr:UDP-N-acetylmuramoyl-L-alanyl-D-glutamate--2,6-diaminopimelate ligase [Spirochaetales bacterium]
MAKKCLSELIQDLPNHKLRGSGDTKISALAYDSREVKPGTLFFALPGVHVDGHDYIDAAIEAGAVGILHSQDLPQYAPSIAYVQVEHPRVAMSPISGAFWNHPSREMSVIGVTGTDGKSTTVSFIRQLLEFTDAPTGSISTVDIAVGNTRGANPLRQSTPEAPQIHALLRAMLDAGQTHAVVEATSHGLSPKNNRLGDVAFDAAVFTNVTSEHLEFHGDLDTYRKDKSRLFSMMGHSRNRDAFGVVNMDDPHADLFIAAAGEKPVYTYSMKEEEADILATDLNCEPNGTEFTVVSPWGEVRTRINLPGAYNVENALAALCVVAEMRDADILELAERLPELEGVKGRMEPIHGDMDFHVMVDYAHSPGSFEKILPFLKSLTKGKLILVFGSAGERDVEKRPKQGEIASRFAEKIYLTDEDPRGENSMDILEDIAAGVSGLEEGKSLFLIPDRNQAIHAACASAENDDLVAVLGKGHESSIIYANKSQPWDEAKACREALQDLGYEL